MLIHKILVSSLDIYSIFNATRVWLLVVVTMDYHNPLLAWLITPRMSVLRVDQ